MTGMPLRYCPLEGPARRVRYAMLDNPFQFVEHDKRARPKRFVGSAGRFPTNETQRPRRFASDLKP